jgi:very-short-patch-repair endonuclease
MKEQQEDPHPQPLSQGGRGELEQAVYWDIPHSLKQRMTEVARQFRKKPTPSENILWQAIRSRKLAGRKFRRQQPIGVFVVDFFCSSEQLIVEVDGSIHESQRQCDQQRQELLELLNLKVVRISSEQVEQDLDSALVLIRQSFNSSSQPEK